MTYIRAHVPPEDGGISKTAIFEHLGELLSSLQSDGYGLETVLAVPPDITRLHSGSGEVLAEVYRHLGNRLTDVLPAVGTHVPMSAGEIARMYPDIPASLFRPHDFRRDVVNLGSIDAAFIEEQSEGKLSFEWPAQISRMVAAREHDLVLSIGQVVPHEVIGMANHSKNLFVGTGGAEAIDKSHYLGAVYGMERIMGIADTPVRRVLDRAADSFTGDLNVVYILTVVAPGPEGHPVITGLFAGSGTECFYEASELARKYNVVHLDRAPETVVVSLDPETYHSTWVGNKAIYRTRKAIADAGSLYIHAPGVKVFGEDTEIDRLIRRYGYCGTEAVLDAVDRESELSTQLSAAAHLIHGSSEGRFSVTWAPDGLAKEEIESVGYQYSDPDTLAERFRIPELKDGWNTVNGEEVFYISQPGLGLWEADRG
ncbi:MAG: lactate racemase domain-containing protein [Spirochaetota bacterium]